MSTPLTQQEIDRHVAYYAGQMEKAGALNSKVHQSTRKKIARLATEYAKRIKREHGVDLDDLVFGEMRRAWAKY